MERLKRLLLKVIRLLPDKPYLYVLFYMSQGRLMQLKDPERFTDKMQWLKLYGNLERFARYADKYTVREYIEQKVGKQYLIPLLGVWDQFKDIPFDTLPDRFVLKVSHACGYNYICKDKSKIDYAELKKTIDGWLHEDFARIEREQQYKPCTPRIVCEEYLEDETGQLPDYKFYCSHGEPQIIQVDADRHTARKSDLLDTHWHKLDYISSSFNTHERLPKKPATLPEMLKLVRILSKDFPFVRVDLYSIGSKVYFGELTFTPGSGLVKFSPDSGDVEFGKLINLDAYTAARTVK